MKTASIISVGTEIIRGNIFDTNSSFISKSLNHLSIDVKWHISVEDIIDDIVKAIDFVKSSDLIIITGGLGPTDDDLTREALSAYLNNPLNFDPEMWEHIKNLFIKRNLSVPVSNKKQAMKINGSEFLFNRFGTAPGIYYNHKNKLFFLLPGPPVENQPMIKEFLEKKLRENKFLEGNIHTEVIRIYNSGESEIAEIISKIKINSELGYYFTQNGWIEIHLTKKGNDKFKNKETVEKDLSKIIKKLKSKNKALTENIDLSLLLLNKMKEKKLTLSFAESITGGNLTGDFIKNSGASEVFISSIVAYSNESKIKLLNVSEETLLNYGAVSKETALEMASGLKEKTYADICVSVTGIAGPKGGSKEKPVGLVYFGFILKDKKYSKKENFFGTRERIIKRCINYIFMEILNNI
ncbi:MAG: CinA family nicotinamide mononucleotide deamidase-related protein [Spirochaetes bacterium]|nr:CinA family nicotinamide mononucleotide deamidase-related protein [Spirochaetota bacterium]